MPNQVIIITCGCKCCKAPTHRHPHDATARDGQARPAPSSFLASHSLLPPLFLCLVESIRNFSCRACVCMSHVSGEPRRSVECVFAFQSLCRVPGEKRGEERICSHSISKELRSSPCPEEGGRRRRRFCSQALWLMKRRRRSRKRFIHEQTCFGGKTNSRLRGPVAGLLCAPGDADTPGGG